MWPTVGYSTHFVFLYFVSKRKDNKCTFSYLFRVERFVSENQLKGFFYLFLLAASAPNCMKSTGKQTENNKAFVFKVWPAARLHRSCKCGKGLSLFWSLRISQNTKLQLFPIFGNLKIQIKMCLQKCVLTL